MPLSTDPGLNQTQLLALAIIELRPTSVPDALSSWRYASERPTDVAQSFEAAIGNLLTRGYIRFEADGRLAITIAGRAALTWR